MKNKKFTIVLMSMGLFFLTNSNLLVFAESSSFSRLPYKLIKVLGQPNEKETMANRIVANLGFHIGGVHVDSFATPNRIYVLDSGNNRILGFLGYRGPGQSADIVIGQPSLFDAGTTNGDNTRYLPASDSTLAIQPYPDVISTAESPRSMHMATDKEGNLYIVDLNNNRALKYNDPFGTDQIADEVWGQEDFVQRAPNQGQAQSNDRTLWTDWNGGAFSSGVDIDRDGNLWVTDTGNNRVLRFPQGSKSADLVLGQPDFQSNIGTSGFDKLLDKMTKPLAVRVHPKTGAVYVLEGEWAGQARVLVFNPPFSNGMFASREIGRAEYQDTEPPPGPERDRNWAYIYYKWVHLTTGLHWPRGLAFDPSGQGDIWVADGGNQRTLLFDSSGRIVDLMGQPNANTRGCLGEPGQGYKQIDGTRAMLCDCDGEIGVDSQNNLYIAKLYLPLDISRFATPLTRLSQDPDRYVWSNGKLLGGWNQVSSRTVQDNYGMAITDFQLFVSDGQRILVWDNYQQAQTFQEASFVIGQDTMDTNRNNNGGIFSARSVTAQTTDQQGRLWVCSDYRVYVFQTPITSNDKNYPTLKILESNNNVIWQHDGTPVEFNPSGIAYDEANDALWIGDIARNRLLRIANPLGTARVDLVIGQPDKISSAPNAGAGRDYPSRQGLSNPTALKFDRYGNLYVVDASFELNGNCRLLRFDAQAIRPEYYTTVFPLPQASGVFTKNSFTSRQTRRDQPGSPTGLAFDSHNNMVLLTDGYGNDQYERAYYYTRPEIGETHEPAAVLDLPLAQGAMAQFDANDNLIIQDHTWNRILFVILPPSAPSNLTASAVAPDQINLAWQDNSTNETGFKIERKTGASGTYSEIATLAANATSYIDSGLTPGTTYTYRVRAYNSGGNSDYSNTVSVTTPQPPDLVVSNIKFYKPQSQERPQDEVTPTQGQLVTCKAILKNQGQSGTGIFNVKWFLDGRQVGYGSHANLLPGETSNDNVRFDWTPTIGKHTLIFVADCDNHVSESNETNNSFSKTITILNSPPKAIIKAIPKAGPSPLKVQFYGDKSYDPDGKIVSYFWNFGDGATSKEINPVHIFRLNWFERFKWYRVYKVSLRVKDNQGATNTAGIIIRVYQRWPWRRR